MDVNGSRFHLILGEGDWLTCRELNQTNGFTDVEYQSDRGMLSLRRKLHLFRPDRPSPPLQPESRRGAVSDRFGNWYWIGQDRQTLYWQQPGGATRIFWQASEEVCAEDSGDFAPVGPSTPGPDLLAGLAVTGHHYLVAGDVTKHALLIFDLYAGRPPLVLGFPDEIPFEPFDLAAAPHGGVWVLDRAHKAYWGLDRYFRAISDPASLQTIEPAEALDFRPVLGDQVVVPGRSFPRGFPIAATDPTSIVGLPDGSVSILDAAVPAGSISSALLRYRLQNQLGATVRLEDDVLVEVSGSNILQRLGVEGYDFEYIPVSQTTASGQGVLYVVDVHGEQVIAFDLTYDSAALSLRARVDYLPMHYFGARALASGPNDGVRGVFYDLDRTRDDTRVRWVALRAIEQPRYVSTADLYLGTRSQAQGALPYFDSGNRDCVWHRLFLDACMPPQTSVTVYSRTANNLEDLENTQFLQEPLPYLRGAGAEVPFYDPFPGRSPDATDFGTWETLLQAAKGRFLQVKLTITGNGRVSPYLRAARAYYPRFSYLKRYLPAVYQEDPESGDFTERLLANMEGFNTEIEGKITEAYHLFDARTATPEALDWLAGWIGLVLDPLWASIQARRQGRSGVCTSGEQSLFDPPADRRRLFIRFARKLYERRGTLSGIRFALHLLLDPCLEETLAAFKAAATQHNPVLRDLLQELGLPYPTPVTSEEGLEDLLYDMVLAPGRPSKVRLVESFQARDGRALALGDVTAQGESLTTSIADAAHRFTVLVPDNLLDEEVAMVDRVIGLEKPAHTLYSVARYYDYFRVGEARLGTDTVLGEESRFVAMVLDRNYLNQGYLYPAPSAAATTERLITDRDSIGLRPL